VEPGPGFAFRFVSGLGFSHAANPSAHFSRNQVRGFAAYLIFEKIGSGSQGLRPGLRSDARYAGWVARAFIAALPRILFFEKWVGGGSWG